MFDEYMTMYNLLTDIMPVLIVFGVLALIFCNVMLRWEMTRMRQLESDIRNERRKLMHERTELERKYHYYM